MEDKMLKLVILLLSISIVVLSSTIRNDTSTHSIHNGKKHDENVINEVDEMNSTEIIDPLVEVNPLNDTEVDNSTSTVESSELSDEMENKTTTTSTVTEKTTLIADKEAPASTTPSSKTESGKQKRIKKNDNTNVALPSEAFEKLNEAKEKFENTADIIRSKIDKQKKDAPTTLPADNAPIATESAPPVSQPEVPVVPVVVDGRIDPRNNAHFSALKAQDPAVTISGNIDKKADSVVVEPVKADDSSVDTLTISKDKTSDDSKSDKPDITVDLSAPAVDAKEGNSGDFSRTVDLPPLNGPNSQSVLVVGDGANATVRRTSNSISVEAHNIL